MNPSSLPSRHRRSSTIPAPKFYRWPLLAACIELVVSKPCDAESLPHVVAIAPSGEVIVSGISTPHSIKVGETAGNWTLMAVINAPGNTPAAVFEDLTDMRGRMIIMSANEVLAHLPKSMEPSSAAAAARLYRGHSLEEVKRVTRICSAVKFSRSRVIPILPMLPRVCL